MFRILILLLTLTTFQAFGQDRVASEEEKEKEKKEKIPLGERLYYTGGLILNYDGRLDIWQIGVSPNVGYKFNEYFSMGLGFNYQWWRFGAADVSSHNYGGKAFARGKLPANILLQYEYERTSFSNGFGDRQWLVASLAGIGYHIPQNDVVSINLFVFYNLNRTQNDALYTTEVVPRVEIAYNF